MIEHDRKESLGIDKILGGRNPTCAASDNLLPSHEENMNFRIRQVEHFPQEELFRRLKRVTMLHRRDVFVYENAEIRLEEVPVDRLYPAQRYVLVQELMKVRHLKWELARRHYDLFHLDGYLKVWLEGESDPLDLLPPVVEEWVEANGQAVNLINDGMHRLYLAYLEWVTPQVILVRNIPPEYPYYAFPNPTQWHGVEWVDSLPEGYVKKWHRIADYKTLYRDFNSAFDRVGAPRGRFTKPDPS